MSQLDLFPRELKASTVPDAMWMAYERAGGRHGPWWDAEGPWARAGWVHRSEAPAPACDFSPKAKEWGPLAWAVMCRAPWDPAEPPRSEKRYRSGPGPRGDAHRTLNDVIRRTPVAELAGILRSSLELIQLAVGPDDGVRVLGTTFHSVVMVAWQEWGADCFVGTMVEAAMWQLYEDGEIVFAPRRLAGEPRATAPLVFWSLSSWAGKGA